MPISEPRQPMARNTITEHWENPTMYPTERAETNDMSQYSISVYETHDSRLNTIRIIEEALYHVPREDRPRILNYVLEGTILQEGERADVDA